MAAGVYLSEALDPLLPPSPPALHIVCITVGTCAPVLIDGGGEGWGGVDEPCSEKLRGALVHKRGRKYQHDSSL